MKLVCLGVAALILAGCGPSLEEMARFTAKQGQELVSRQLLDPDSAKWGSVWVSDGVTCGWLSGKDRSGTLSPPRRFYALGPRMDAEVDGGKLDRDAFDAYWNVECSRAEFTIVAGQPAGPVARPLTDMEKSAKGEAVMRATYAVVNTPAK